jgi:ABC-2 type transport system permease protein
MSISARRVQAIYRKELREYRRKRSIVVAMAIYPLLFLIQPLIATFTLPAASADQITNHHELLYLLAIPALVPATLSAYAVAGERQQGTLEPVLTTPVRREELLLGKALAVLAPSIAISYAVPVGWVRVADAPGPLSPLSPDPSRFPAMVLVADPSRDDTRLSDVLDT